MLFLWCLLIASAIGGTDRENRVMFPAKKPKKRSLFPDMKFEYSDKINGEGIRLYQKGNEGGLMNSSDQDVNLHCDTFVSLRKDMSKVHVPTRFKARFPNDEEMVEFWL